MCATAREGNGMRSNSAALAAKRQRMEQRAEEGRVAMVRNQCIEALAALPDPKQALAVVQSIQRSILEFMAHQR